MLIVLSLLPETTVFWSADKAMDHTQLECSLKSKITYILCRLHSFTVWSRLLDTKVSESSKNFTYVTGDLCPLRVLATVILCIFHSLIILSPLPEAKNLESCENATERTHFESSYNVVI